MKKANTTAGKPTYTETMTFYGKAYVRFFVKNPDQARLMFSGMLCTPDKFPAAHQAGMGTYGQLLSLIQLGQAEGHIRKKYNPMLLGLMIWSSIYDGTNAEGFALKMKRYLVFTYLVFLVACVSNSQKDYKFIENSAVINQNPKKMLTPGQVNYDIQQTIYALEMAYSGKKFLPAGEYDTLLKNLSSMNQSLSAIDFCEKLGAFMEPISDSHLSAKFNNIHCYPKKNRRKSQVGKNFYSAVKDIPWNTTLMQQSKKTALLISITQFPSRASPVWNGFIDEVKTKLRKSNLVILDLRGNGGGDDATGFELATLLAGSELKQPYTKQWNSPSAEAQQVFVNVYDFWARADQEKGRNSEPYILDLKHKFIQERDRIINSLPDNKKSDDEDTGQNFVFAKSIRKPIYILIDADCASSCESTIDFFEFNPLAKTVGENTAGYVHFGNNGAVFLKNSGIEIKLATSYNGYKDDRFLEKVGLKPKIAVPPGKDALDFAWSDFLGRK